MINIVVWSHSYVDIENKKYEIINTGDMIIFLKALLDKAYYSGETLCLESATVNIDKGKAEFTEIDRYK